MPSTKQKSPKTRPLDIDTLWKLQRLSDLSLSPDGAQAVVSVTRADMAENKSTASLWLLSTLGGRPRELTHCGSKDGQPHFSPDGQQIAFVAKREQQGAKDEEPQLYLIAPDGGEARRVTTLATGVEAFRWCPDGRHIVLVSWVWPDLKGLPAQAKAMKAFKERKESGYATAEALYRHWDHALPMGRVPHLLRLDTRSGAVRDLFDGSAWALPLREPGSEAFDISPDGRRIVFVHDPARPRRNDARHGLAEVDLARGRIAPLLVDPDWDFGSPRYSPDGGRIAFSASHQAVKLSMPQQLAVWQREDASWEVVSAEWDHEVDAPLHWEDDGQALLFCAEQKGRRHLWRFDLPDRRAEIVVEGGWVQRFDKAAGTLVTLADSAMHPARATAWLPGQRPRRIEHFNDALLAKVTLGRVEETWVEGAEGDRVQVWLTYPPGFDAKKRYPLLQAIHGGPHGAFGDAWSWRWNVQVFAGLGNAGAGRVVAAVNYHGSSGFGYAFKDSISHRYGALELIDIEAATSALLDKPWVDKTRVHAAGGSYGGYMVAWMNGQVKPGRYAAYVCHAGCFDWTAMFADDCYAYHQREFGAWYWDDPAQIDRQSPRAFAHAMQTPTLVIHGALDYRVPDAQGLAYYNTLQARGVDSRLLWFADENHWILKPRNSRQWFGEFGAWLERHGGKARVAKSGQRGRKA